VIVSVIVALDEAGTIGRDGGLPWHLPDDLHRFKATTMGHVLLMGRKTFESIGRALPGRRSLVLTRNPAFRPPAGVEAVPDLDTAFARAAGAARLFVIGGAEVFRAALPVADELLVTQIHATVAGDVRFPDVDWDAWSLVADEFHPADARHAVAFSFRRFVRRA
jgi:dihydrofolate reductase